MPKYKIIGNMTGNSMDAIDLVLTEFDGDKMTDICTFSHPYTKDMQEKINLLREKVFAKTAKEIQNIPEFYTIHNEYVEQIAECINEMCTKPLATSNLKFTGRSDEIRYKSAHTKCQYARHAGVALSKTDL